MPAFLQSFPSWFTACLVLALLALLKRFADRLEADNNAWRVSLTAEIKDLKEDIKLLKDSIKSDAEILNIVNGKYISRVEMNLMSKNSEGLHERLHDHIVSVDSQVSSIRKMGNWARASLDIIAVKIGVRLPNTP